jgi:hypothetical protein
MMPSLFVDATSYLQHKVRPGAEHTWQKRYQIHNYGKSARLRKSRYEMPRQNTSHGLVRAICSYPERLELSSDISENEGRAEEM